MGLFTSKGPITLISFECIKYLSKTERTLRQKEEEDFQSAIKESKKNQMQSFVIKNAETEPIITVKVIGQDCNGLNFRVKMSTNMGMLKKSYAERFGVPVSSLKFCFNGHHISDNESPKGGFISESSNFGSNLTKNVPNYYPEHYPPKEAQNTKY